MEHHHPIMSKLRGLGDPTNRHSEDWTRLNKFGMFEEQENNVVLNENSVDIKPYINREIKSDELTI